MKNKPINHTISKQKSKQQKKRKPKYVKLPKANEMSMLVLLPGARTYQFPREWIDVASDGFSSMAF